MTNLSPEFCRKVKEARQAAKLGQTVVAAKVGCKQTALSMFENGGVTKLSDEAIAGLSKLFGIEIVKVEDVEATQETSELEELKTEAATCEVVVAGRKGFCPNPKCPSNHAYEVNGRVLLRPDLEAADPVVAKFCAVCGEVLEKHCPSCGASIHAGAICSHCGEAYIAI